MAKDVIMPALGMAQETGTLLRWIRSAGETVTKGEPLMEVETDKAAVEIEAPASGILAAVTANPGDVVPVGQRIALILAPGEAVPAVPAQASAPAPVAASGPVVAPAAAVVAPPRGPAPLVASPLAARMAAEQGIDLARVKPEGGRVQKEDVVAYLQARSGMKATSTGAFNSQSWGRGKGEGGRGRVLASPKARRLAGERGVDLATLTGSGPEGAVLAADVFAVAMPAPPVVSAQGEAQAVSRIWRVMAERLTQAWTTIPQFHVVRDVDATRLSAWRDSLQQSAREKITYTDLLTLLVAAALRRHPRLNASWSAERRTIVDNLDVNVGLAVAVEDGLLVPVIHHADALGPEAIAARRADLVSKAQSGRLSLDELSGGTFTISNLGMYGVDSFTAIVNPPQAAILAVGRIADRVVAVEGKPAVRPMMTLSLSCDHRVADGARAAQFMQTLAGMIEDPQRSLD